jgi:hypothetical protein
VGYALAMTDHKPDTVVVSEWKVAGLVGLAIFVVAGSASILLWVDWIPEEWHTGTKNQKLALWLFLAVAGLLCAPFSYYMELRAYRRRVTPRARRQFDIGPRLGSGFRLLTVGVPAALFLVLAGFISVLLTQDVIMSMGALDRHDLATSIERNFNLFVASLIFLMVVAVFTIYLLRHNGAHNLEGDFDVLLSAVRTVTTVTLIMAFGGLGALFIVAMLKVYGVLG